MKARHADAARVRCNYTEMRASGKCLSPFRMTLSPPRIGIYTTSFPGSAWERNVSKLRFIHSWYCSAATTRSRASACAFPSGAWERDVGRRIHDA